MSSHHISNNGEKKSDEINGRLWPWYRVMSVECGMNPSDTGGARWKASRFRRWWVLFVFVCFLFLLQRGWGIGSRLVAGQPVVTS